MALTFEKYVEEEKYGGRLINARRPELDELIKRTAFENAEIISYPPASIPKSVAELAKFKAMQLRTPSLFFNHGATPAQPAAAPVPRNEGSKLTK